MADFTCNISKDLGGPIPFVLMGKIADRPETAERNTVFVSTDEAAGEWKIYWFDDQWNQFKGISKS